MQTWMKLFFCLPKIFLNITFHAITTKTEIKSKTTPNTKTKTKGKKKKKRKEKKH